jgi:uncharacterized protein YcaQ
METLSVRQARRLALARAGLLKPRFTGLPDRAAGRGRRARDRCHSIIDRFGYLQLDSVCVAGARTHAIVLASRLENFDTRLGEELLAPGEPLFEYWGHEACWLPIALYPVFAFRRREYRVHPWWGDLLGEHPRIVAEIMRRVEEEGAFRSVDLEGRGGPGWWDLKLSKRIAEALWSAGELAISGRRHFHRSFDLPERVIPGDVLHGSWSDDDAFDFLLLKALEGHGWASTGTLAATWRLTNCHKAIAETLERLVECGRIVPCRVEGAGRGLAGWVRPEDLDAVDALDGARLQRDRGVLLSPFDPVLWDRERVRLLFGFDQVLEIYKPADARRFGYYCLPVLAGDGLIARVDLKADRKSGRLLVLSCHHEHGKRRRDPAPRERQAVDRALSRFASSVGLAIDGQSVNGGTYAVGAPSASD